VSIGVSVLKDTDPGSECEPAVLPETGTAGVDMDEVGLGVVADATGLLRQGGLAQGLELDTGLATPLLLLLRAALVAGER